MREINVNVGQFVEGHALLVQTAAEVQIEADRTDAANAQAITNETVRCAPPRDPFDTATTTFLQHVPGDEEIIFVTNIGDHTKFLHDLWLELVRPLAVTVF